MNLLSSLIGNILANYNYLLQDYTGFKINPSIIFNFSINLLLSMIIIAVFYLIGLKIKNLLFKQENKNVNIFIEIALAYIVTASGILILGMLSILYKQVLYIYFIILLVLAAYPLNTTKKRLFSAYLIIKNDYINQFKKHKLANIAILCFILISFLRLIPPEVGVDALWYHTDYPQIYLKSHSMMTIDPRGKFYPAVTPTLSDMLYVVTESLSMKESSRFIHFAFYVLSILVYLNVFKKRYSFAPIAALLFATCPIIIRVAPSAYAESQWIFLWLLAVFLITSRKIHTLNDILLPAILVGGTLATKLWMLPFYGVFILYILFSNLNQDKFRLLKSLFIFTLITFLIPFLWYLRAFIITGNPLFPTFWNYPDGSSNNPFAFSSILSSFSLEGIKVRILSSLNVSPFSVIGFIFITPYLKKINFIILKKYPFIIFIVLLTLIQIIINYSFHRFVIPFYSIIAVILAFGIAKFISINKYFKYSYYLLVIGIFLYYFINTLLILPYGLGYANKNRYLSRIISRDNSSYYDYNNQFSKFINKNDLVATYNLYGFYYADFNYVHTEEVFRKIDRSLNIIKIKGATKLLILGGDINWLCKNEKLKDCTNSNNKLLTFYKFPTTASSQYLYDLNTYAK